MAKVKEGNSVRTDAFILVLIGVDVGATPVFPCRKDYQLNKFKYDLHPLIPSF